MIDIYRYEFLDTKLEEKLEAIEKALGFKLFIWQKTYIERGVFRQYGETTAKILKELIEPGNIINYSEPPKSRMEHFHRRMLLEIKQKLEENGIETNKVARNKAELRQYMNERANNASNIIKDQVAEALEKKLNNAICEIDY